MTEDKPSYDELLEKIEQLKQKVEVYEKRLDSKKFEVLCEEYRIALSKLRDNEVEQEMLLEEQARTNEELMAQNEEYAALNEEYLTTNESLKDTLTRLKISESRYKRLVDVAFDAIFLVDEETNFVDFNEVACQMLGRTRDGLYGMKIGDIDTIFSKNVFDEFWKDKPFDTQFIVETNYKHIDGFLIPVEVKTTKLVLDEKLYYYAIVRDIRERKQAVQRLQESKELAETYLKVAKVMFLAIDRNGVITLVNDKAVEVIGEKAEEIVGKKWFENYLPASNNQEVKAVFTKMMNAELESAEFYENTIITAKGEERLIAWHNTVLKDSNGQITGTLSSGEDITESRKTQNEIARIAKEWQTTYDASNDGIWILDENNVIIRSNKTAAELFNSNVDDLQGKHCWEIVHNAIQPIEGCPVQRVKKSLKRETMELNRGDRWFAIIADPILDEKGNYAGAVHVVNDITESKLRQEKLIETQNRLVEAQKTAHIGHFELDVETNRISLADEIYNIIEIEKTNSNVTLKKVFDYFYEVDKEKLKECINNISENKVSYQIDLNAVLPTGKRIIVNWIGKPVVDDKGRVIKITGTIQDVTIRKAIEFELKQRNTFIQTVLDNLPIGVALNNIEDGTATYMNKKFEEIYGWTQSDISNVAEFFEKVFPDKQYREMVIERIMGDINSMDPARMHWENIFVTTKEGVKHTIDAVNIPLIEQNAMVSTVIDVTDRWKALNELTDSKERFKMLSQLTFEGIVVHKDGICIDANQSFCNLIGYEFEEILEKDVIELMVREDYREKVRFKVQTLNTGPYEIIGLKKDGTHLPLEIMARNIKWKDDLVRVVAVRDITERKKYEEELIKQKQKAEESDYLKSAFLANMSHEIRTPMNSIIGFSSFLKDEDITIEERDEFIAIIENSSKQLLRLINDIIDISKIESGVIDLMPVNFNLEATLEEFKTEFSVLAKHKNIDFKVNVEKELKDSLVYCDINRFKQILSNLIGNAVKFTNKGLVEVGCKKVDYGIEFYVEDTGIGIAKYNFDLIFDRFRQVEDYSTRRHQGTGLGLAITKALISKMGGYITLESIENKGTKFTFFLPMVIEKKSDSQEDIQEIKSDKIQLFDGKKFLIAEDEDLNYVLLDRILAKTKAKLIRAKNGIEAVELYKRYKPDLVLMDIKMPVVNGFEATIRIRKIDKDIPIIAVSAYAMADDRDKALKAGCNDYISKPYVSKEIFDKAYALIK